MEGISFKKQKNQLWCCKYNHKTIAIADSASEALDMLRITYQVETLAELIATLKEQQPQVLKDLKKRGDN